MNIPEILVQIEPFARAAQHAILIKDAVNIANLDKQGLTPLGCFGMYAAIEAAQSSVSWANWEGLAVAAKDLIEYLNLLNEEKPDEN